MPSPTTPTRRAPEARRQVMESFGQSAFRDFHMAFALMSIIPILITVYVLAARLFTLDVFEGMTGVFFLAAVIIALLGFLVGRRLIQEALAQLVEANARIRQHETMKSGFIANVAYELRPPLSAVKMSLKNLADGLLGPLSGTQQEAVEDCHGTIDRLARLTTDLIDVADSKQGTPRLSLDVFELKDMIREAVEANAASLTAQHLQASVKLPQQPALFFGDRVKLTQAVRGLLDYAARWSSLGSAVQIELASRPDEWRVMVGHDISPPAAGESRRPLTVSQADGADPPHVGLGLTLAKDVAELHHGRFWAEGRLGEDIRLVISLPVVEAVPGRAESSS